MCVLEVNDDEKHDFTIKIDGEEKLVGLVGKITTLIHARTNIVDKDTDVFVKLNVGHREGRTWVLVKYMLY